MSIKLVKVIKILSILALNLANTLSAQHTFECTYGGELDDRAQFVQQLTDENYILVGTTTSYGSGEEDIYLIKVDVLGDTIWTKTFGSGYIELGTCVQQTSDQGYIIAGYQLDLVLPSGSDLLLLKSDPDGDQTWIKTFANSGKQEYGHSVRQTSDGGYIIAGDINHGTPSGPQFDVYLIKTDSSGVEQWAKTYNGIDNDFGNCVQQTSDGGYVIAGYTGSYDTGNFDVYLIKTYPSGDTLWTRTYGGPGLDHAYCLQQTSDNGYIIAGHTNSYGKGGYDIYLIKTNSSGDTLWTRTYGGPDLDFGTSVNQTSDEGYIIAGYTNSFGAGDFDVYMIKTNSFGDTLWTRTYGGPHRDFGTSVNQTSDEGYIIAGYTESFGAGDFDIYLIKTNAFGIVTDIDETVLHVNPASFHLAQNYPNPFNPTTTIKFDLPKTSKVTLKIFNILGKEVATLVSDKLSAGSYSYQWSRPAGIASGVYLYRLQAGDPSQSTGQSYVETRKMVLIR